MASVLFSRALTRTFLRSSRAQLSREFVRNNSKVRANWSGFGMSGKGLATGVAITIASGGLLISFAGFPTSRPLTSSNYAYGGTHTDPWTQSSPLCNLTPLPGIGRPPDAAGAEEESLHTCLVWPKRGKYEEAIVKVTEILFRHKLCDILRRHNLNDPTATIPGAEMPEIDRFMGDEFMVRLPKGKSPLKDEIRALPEVEALYEFGEF